MKVLHVTRLRGVESRFGLGRSVQQLIDGQRASGLDVTQLSADDLDPERLRRAMHRARAWGSNTASGQLPVWPIISQAMAVGELAAAFARANGITHVHCHDAVIATALRRSLGRQAVRWGVTLHGFDTVAQSLHRYVTTLPPWLRWWLLHSERQTLCAAHWVIALTSLGCAQVARQLRTVTTRHWHVVPHARPDWPVPDRRLARAELGWDARQRYLLAVGQLVPSKRFDWIIRAMPSAPPGWRLVLLGDGDRVHCERLAATLGIPPPEIVVTDTPAGYFAAADAYASASAIESFGMANLEALHAGLPALCTAVGGVPEVVGDGAILVADSEPEFAAHLVQLLSDEPLQRTMHNRATERICRWPAITAIAERHLSIYAGDPRQIG